MSNEHDENPGHGPHDDGHDPNNPGHGSGPGGEGHGQHHGGHGQEHGGHHPPQAPHRPKLFKIQIDKKPYETSNPQPTGRELLHLAGKVPPEQFGLYLRGKGQPQRIGLDEKVNLEEPGVERFVTLPLDQTEG